MDDAHGSSLREIIHQRERTRLSLAGISKKSIYRWMRKGASQKSAKYVEFLHAVEKAMGEGQNRHYRKPQLQH